MSALLRGRPGYWLCVYPRCEVMSDPSETREAESRSLNGSRGQCRFAPLPLSSDDRCFPLRHWVDEIPASGAAPGSNPIGRVLGLATHIIP